MDPVVTNLCTWVQLKWWTQRLYSGPQSTVSHTHFTKDQQHFMETRFTCWEVWSKWETIKFSIHLLTCCPPPVLSATVPGSTTEDFVNTESVAPASWYPSSLHEWLLAVGGKDSDGKVTTDIHMYNTTTNSWEVISHMGTPWCQCLVAVLPHNELMVVAYAWHDGLCRNC